MAADAKILIVDDDVDFAALLSDVFTQASYQVTKANDPKEAVKLLDENSYNLLVTDLRMPGMDGFELSRAARSKHPDMPIIMVSGFLEDKDKNRMQEEGIVGTYEKPLSVFTLLKNAADLIDKKSKKQETPEDEDTPEESSSVRKEPTPGFSFTALPCLSKASKDFAAKLYKTREKHTNFCLIAPKGTPIQSIGENFCQWMEDVHIPAKVCGADACKEADVKAFLEQARDSGAEEAVLFITGLEDMNPNQQRSLSKATRKGGIVEDWDGNLRLILCLQDDVETLYQKGVLSDEIYLSIGTTELFVPPLKSCPEDIEEIAKNLVNEEGVKYEWTPEALEELRMDDWPGNHASLRKTLHNITKTVSGRPVTREDVGKALHVENNEQMSKMMQREISLLETLTTQRYTYIRGALELSDNDVHTVAALLEIPVELVEKVQKSG